MNRFNETTPILAIMMVFTVLALPALGQVTHEDFKILTEDGDSGDAFSRGLDVNGGILAAGARYDQDNGHWSGSAYLLDSATGAQLFKLVPEDGQPESKFGISIGIDAGIVAVGASQDADPNAHGGSVYLFDTSTGEELLKLTPTDPSLNKYFGYRLDIDDGIVAITAIGDGNNGSYAGAAYLFDVETGDELFKLLPDDGASGDGFGQSIAIDNGLVVVGSYHDDDNGSNSGSAYLFDVQTGVQLAKLLPEDGTSLDEFGITVALENDTVVVGARYEYYGFGAVYLFDATTFAQTIKIKPNELAMDTEFGNSVAISNNVVAVAEHHSDLNNNKAGTVFLFDASTGEQLDRLQPSDSIQNHYFGVSLAMVDGFLFCGADGDQDNGFGAGAVYAFELGDGGVSAVPLVSQGLNLYPNHPNPFNPSTTISYSLEKDGYVELSVYSARGELLRTLVRENQLAGTVQSVVWDGKDGNGRTLSSGVYYARLMGQGSAAMQKMVLLK